MLDDVQAVADFYASARGHLAAGLLGRHLQAFWPDLSRLTVLGLGHTTPFLPLWYGQAAICIDASTSAGAGSPVPGAHCLVSDDALPFPDGSIDRVLVVHGIEHADQTTRLLRAVSRVLRDDGKLLVVVSNWSGLWAHVETTPFADGAPCSAGRIERMLARSLFRIDRMQGALYAPPGAVAPLRRLSPLIETASRFVTPRVAGVLVVEAVKDLYAAVPAVPRPTLSRRRRLLVSLGAGVVRQAMQEDGVQAPSPLPGQGAA